VISFEVLPYFSNAIKGDMQRHTYLTVQIALYSELGSKESVCSIN